MKKHFFIFVGLVFCGLFGAPAFGDDVCSYEGIRNWKSGDGDISGCADLTGIFQEGRVAPPIWVAMRSKEEITNSVGYTGNPEAVEAILKAKPSAAREMEKVYPGRTALRLAIENCCVKGTPKYPNKTSDIVKIIIKYDPESKDEIYHNLKKIVFEPDYKQLYDTVPNATMLDYVRYIMEFDGDCIKTKSYDECKKIENILIEAGVPANKGTKTSQTYSGTSSESTQKSTMQPTEVVRENSVTRQDNQTGLTQTQIQNEAVVEAVVSSDLRNLSPVSVIGNTTNTLNASEINLNGLDKKIPTINPSVARAKQDDANIKKCIKYIKENIFSDYAKTNTLEYRLYIKKPDSDTKYTLTKDEAQSISPNWKYDNYLTDKFYVHSEEGDVLQDHEKDACNVAQKLKDFINKHTWDNETNTVNNENPSKAQNTNQNKTGEENKKEPTELQKAYDEARAKEQSTANKLLGGLTTAATGIGGMQLMQGLAEQSADKNATADMAAYIETMRCTYGDGNQVKAGPEEIELPGANDQELMNLRGQYLSLAADLKERKEALDMKPGIESEVIVDRTQTGLYENENVGITSGNYASLYRAQALNSETDQAKIADQQNTSANRVKGGAIAAGAGVAVGVAGNSLINGKLGELVKGKEENKTDDNKRNTKK